MPQNQRRVVLYRDFINITPTQNAVQVYASHEDHLLLSTYINLGHVRQYTPSNEFLNGLYAIEISLQAICARLATRPPTFLMLRDIYRSNAFLRDAEQLSSFSNDPIAAAQMLWDLTDTANLSRDALRLVLVYCAQQLNTRLRLGVLSLNNGPAGQACNAFVYDELFPSNLPMATPFTVWIIDDAHYGGSTSEGPLPTHWSGLAPGPVYTALNSEPKLPWSLDEEASGPQAVDTQHNRLASEWSIPDSQRSRSSLVSVINAPLRSNGMEWIRTEYPSDLTEEEALDKHANKMTMELLLYVLRRYKQGELLEQLKQRNVNVNFEALRQRKKAALENRARNQYGPNATKEQYMLVSHQYDEEVLCAGWHEPRAQRGEAKRKLEEDGRNRPIRKKIRSTEGRSMPSRQRRVPAKARATNRHDSVANTAPTERLPFYRSTSIRSYTSDEEDLPQVSALSSPNEIVHTSKVSGNASTKQGDFHASKWVPEGMQPATWPRNANVNPFTGDARDTSKERVSIDLDVEQTGTCSNISEVEIASALQDHAIAAAAMTEPTSKHTASSSNTLEHPQTSPIISGRALSNFFLRAHPHKNGRPDLRAMNGRGIGPPGTATWFRWPRKRASPKLTLEQIDWYFKDEREKRLSPEEREQLHDMKKSILDDIWYTNQKLNETQSSPLSQGVQDIIEISH